MSTCARCGQQHPGCAGHRSGDGQPCGVRPITGGTVCQTHGGRAPQVKRAAAERVAALTAHRRASQVVALWDDQQDTAMSPVEVLARTMTVTYRQAALHRQQLAQQADEDHDPYVKRDKSGREYPSPLALLEQAERRLAADISAKAVSAGLDQALTRLAETQSAALVMVLEAFARELGHDPARPEVRAAARTSILALETGAA